MTFIVPATLVQTSLFTTFTVPAVWCHPLVHLCSNLLVHDLHCTSNLSLNLLVHDLHCTSCAVSPTSSSLFKPPCSWPSLYQLCGVTYQFIFAFLQALFFLVHLRHIAQIHFLVCSEQPSLCFSLLSSNVATLVTRSGENPCTLSLSFSSHTSTPNSSCKD